MARTSKVGSIQHKYGNINSYEFYNGNSATAIFCIGDEFNRTSYSLPWAMRGNCKIVRVLTDKKPVDGVYEVEELSGPYDYMGEGSSNRAFYWTGNNVKIFDYRNVWGYKNEEDLFFGSFKFKFSIIGARFLWETLSRIQERYAHKAEIYMKKKKKEFLGYLFTHEDEFRGVWE